MKRSPQRKAALRRTSSASERLQDRNRKQRRNYFLERLEDRSLLATMIWSGAGADLKFSSAANWVGNMAPQQDDSLVFPAGVTKLGTQGSPLVNDFADGTRFRTITISDGYNIADAVGQTNKLVLL